MTVPLDVDIVIAARNHARSIAQLIREIPPRLARGVVVIDNGSSDATARVAEEAGALVLREALVGHGAACLRAVAHLMTLPRPPEVVVFLAADGSDDPADLPALLAPMRDGVFDMVIGARQGGSVRRRAGERLAVNLIHALYGHRYSDLGSLRAIRYPALVALGLGDASSGFFAEMSVKAVRAELRIAEVPVRARPPVSGGGFGSGLRDRLDVGGRTLYAIIRHATAR